jgi:predicted phosphodiesterase
VRVAALYDVHGNLPALEAVLAEVENLDVDEIVCGGDVVWGPMPSECLSLLRAASTRFVVGNCEREVLTGEGEKARWCRDRLTRNELALIEAWPLTTTCDVDGLGAVLFCHATPQSDLEIVTSLTPDAVVAEALSGVDAGTVVCGHTHVQFDRTVGGASRLVNAGSVGLAYEGEPTARWALLGPDVSLRATALDAESVLDALHDTGFPEVHETFDDALRGKLSAEDASTHFESLRGA